MIKTLRANPEIMDLWALSARWFLKLSHYILIFGAHVLLFKMTAHVGIKDPYTSYKGFITQTRNQKVTRYNFSRLGKTFMAWDSFRLEELDAKTLEALLIDSVPRKLKPRLSKYIQDTLKLCEHYQLDPLWALSIMWTESHFNNKAVSSVSANGLMQVMPGTAHYLMNIMNRPVAPKIAYEMVKDPKTNIQLGVFYLRRLFIQFDFNFKYATIAYNMGPNGVMRRLKSGRSVGRNHLYLKKVKRHYKKLLRPLLAYFKANPAPFQKTLVAQKKWHIDADTYYAFNEFSEWETVALSIIPSQRLEL